MANIRGGSIINGLPITSKAGSNGYLAKFNIDNSLINSLLYENINGIGIGVTNQTEKLEVLGNIKADSFIGNAASASKLQTIRNINLSGSVTGTVEFDGSSDISISTTTNHTHPFLSITGLPTTLSGYGIVDAINISSASSTAVANKLLYLDASSKLSAVAIAADKLSSGRTISLTGTITGSGTFDGSSDISINTSGGDFSILLKKTGDKMTGNLTMGTGTSILPETASGATLGSASLPFTSLYIGANSLYVNGNQILTSTSTTLGIKAMTTGYVGFRNAADTAWGLRVEDSITPKTYTSNNTLDDGTGKATFSGAVTLPADPNNALHAATKQYVDARAPLNSPTLTGIPTAPTAVIDTNTTQIATTGYVVGQSYLKQQGITWTTRIVGPINYNWNDVCYGNGLFVAVAYQGTGNRVMTSPDGITWTARVTPADNAWNAVTYGNGLFVAVAYTGTGNRVMTSPDGITWTIRTSAADNSWSYVTYGNGLFVAVSGDGVGNRVMTSPNGITWTSRTSAADNSWNGVCFGNGLFVAVAESGTGNRVMTSPDGITWTLRTSAVDNSWNAVTYANGLFVSVSYTGVGNRVMTSPNGINWTTRTSTADIAWRAVRYGNGLFVAVASTGTGRAMTSPDGITWTTRTVTDNSWSGIAYGSGIFVAVSVDLTGAVMTSGEILPVPTKLERSIVSQPQLKDYTETVAIDGAVTTTKTLDINTGNVFDLILTGNVTLTLSNSAPSGQSCSITLLVRQGGTAFTITYPASVKWNNDTVPDIGNINSTSIISLVTVNGGTRWYGFLGGNKFIT